MKKVFRKGLIFSLLLALVLNIAPMVSADTTLSEKATEPDRGNQYVVVEFTYILDEGSTAGAIIDSASAGERVTLLSGIWVNGSSVWLKIKHGTNIGYVLSDYLCPVSSCYKVNTSAGLHLRYGPGTNYGYNVTLPYGTYLYHDGTSGNWYHVHVLSGTYDGLNGYVYSSYIISG